MTGSEESIGSGGRAPDGAFAAERTQLAWNRTALGAAIAAAAFIRRLWEEPRATTATTVTLAILLAGGAVLAGMMLWPRPGHHGGPDLSAARQRGVRRFALAVSAFAAAALVLTVVPPE